MFARNWKRDTFGRNIWKSHSKASIVQMCVHTRDGLAVYISCYSVPEIRSPISCQVIEAAKSTYPQLQGLTLADNPTSEEQHELPIDHLLGADNCWQFLEGLVNQGDSWSCCCYIEIWWLLSGPVNV